MLIDNLRYVLNSQLLNTVAKRAKFLKKDSKFTPEKFISLCVFSNNHLCQNSLDELSVWLRVNEDLSITKQGVNSRFNKESVEFLKRLFAKLMMSQSKLLSSNTKSLKSIFNRIDICDATSYKVPEKLKDYYSGKYKTLSNAIVKIQFEYDLLSENLENAK